MKMEGAHESQVLEGLLSGEQTQTIQNEVEQARSEDRNRGEWTALPFIIGTEMGVSLAAAGWETNLIVYLIKEFNIKSINATQINSVVLGCNYLFPIAAAFLADSYFTSFTVITAFASLSLLGMIMLTLTATVHYLRPPSCAIASYACKAPSMLQFVVLYMAIALASLGHGGTNFTIATMGADQFENAYEQGKFFNWFLFTSCTAKAVGYTAIVYIEDNVSWGLGFAVCVIANAIVLAVFLSGKPFYLHLQPKGSPFMSIIYVVVAAIRKRNMRETFEIEDNYHGDHTLMPTSEFKFLNRAALKIRDDSQCDDLCTRSWKICTVEEVEDLKTIIKIIPVWSTGILSSTNIGVFGSLSVLQALTMDRYLGPYMEIPAGSFIVFNLLAIVLSIFIVDRFLLPIWENLTRRSLTLLQRMGVGYFINIFTMVVSALIETRRLQMVRTHMGSMSALWLVLPLTIFGVAEGFVFPGRFAFYYQEFPKSLKNTSTAMTSLLIGIGFYLSSAFIGLVKKSTSWLPNNIDDGRLDYVFCLLTVILVVNFGYFLICAKWFKYQNVENCEEYSSGSAR